MGCSPQGHKESDTERLTAQHITVKDFQAKKKKYTKITGVKLKHELKGKEGK